MDCLSCIFKCLSIFNCKNCLINKFSFNPPRPSSYTIENNNLYLLSKVNSGILLTFPWIDYTLITIPTASNTEIPAIHIINSSANLTLLYCHGNSADLGLLFYYLLELSTQLKVHILAFEYTGYGPSKVKPSESSLEKDAEAAYSYLISKTDWKTIVVYGSSLGSYPACIIAANYKIHALILQSPLASASYIMCSSVGKPRKNDAFNNLKLVSFIKCPVLVIHGEADEVIPICHAKALVKNAKYPYQPLWIERGRHNTLEIQNPFMFYSHIRSFLMELPQLVQAVITKETQEQSLSLEISNEKTKSRRGSIVESTLGRKDISFEQKRFI
ncbi:hypothetical protein SteCoe_10992 [Stentor coeruleus]|uniref:AB hydrolase-1 domain-containing protein n=1 Tax=Stentor coeruleus TaxID=5963 RepID=A0A1R2CE57_9CILI|nr:hypothetical protein SteCoe_10992 [Stentor coeruleus]